MAYSRRAYRRRRRMIRRLQRMIPGVVAILLIAVVVLLGVKKGWFESFSYSYDEEDLYKYFGAISDNSAVIIKDGVITDEQIDVVNGYLYIPLSTVKERYTRRFYYDVHDNALLYTTANEVIKAPVGGQSYTKGGQTISTPYVTCMDDGNGLMVAYDYLALYVNLSYNLQGGNGEPYRAMIFTEWGSEQKATVTHDQAVRKETEKKSNILKELEDGDTVTVLEEGENWTKVMTEDLVIGYYETRYLDDFRTESQLAPTPVSEPEFIDNVRDFKINLIWDMITVQAANDYFTDRIAGQKTINVVSPTWFMLNDSEGNMDCLASQKYVDTAHSMGIEVWALLENITHNDTVNMYELMSYSQKRALLIEQLMQYVAEYKIDGINLDIESISSEAGESYTQFIRELSIACRQAGIVLSVDNYVPTASSAMYDRQQEGLFADYVIIMGYDEHYGGSKESGSVASLNFVIDGMNNTLADVPARKVINAVPLYTRLWIETPKTDAEIALESVTDEFVPYKLDSQTLGMGDAKTTVANAGAVAKWDDASGQNYAEWERNGKTYKIWLEDEDSLAAKIQAMHALDVGGIAAWQMGYAGKAAWNALSKF